jgi:predicted ATPase/DNA-binding SARP family transcriptional activator/DNA-binding CsgD family transcriptional regulator
MGPSAGIEGVKRPEAQHERPEPMRVWLLGGFKVSVGSRTIEGDAWRLRKAAALVKLLTLAPGNRMHREQVMDLLWPDLGKKAASNNLRQTIHAVRGICDPTAASRHLVSEDESLVLCPGGSLWVDVEAFEEAAATARRARDPVAYRAALELYSGDLLPEDRYEEWADGRRNELRQLYLSLLIERAGLYEERGAYRPAIEALRKATAKEPTLEEAHAALMRLHGLSGRPEQALSQYERLRDTLSRELGTQPGAATRHLHAEIAAGRFPPSQPAAPRPPEEPPDPAKHNLPSARTNFVGREREMVEVKRTLAMTGLLTLVGTGGCGKTRLALEVARDLVAAYPDGVWLVELAPLSEGALVPQVVAEAVGVGEQPGRSLSESLLDSLRDKEMLLVLDNCEHLIDAAAGLAQTLIESCLGLRVLATSREALSVDGEALWQVGPLSVPRQQEQPTVEDLAAYESVRLFVERALFVERTLYGSSGFTLGPNNASAVAEVCRHLEGIPLAIELAAAWIGTLTVEQISERLKDSLGLLKGGRTLTRRQRTLRGAMDWSYDLLSEPEQIIFGRLSVFAGGWTLEAAEAVGAGDNVEEEELLELLWRLVNKSLVVAEARKEGTARYRMLEPIRQYAWEKLGASGKADEVQGRHAAFLLTLAEEAEPELAGPQQRLWVQRLEWEHDNLRAALSRVLQRGEAELALRFGGVLWRFWFDGGHLSEGVRWLEQVLAGGEPAASSVRVKALEGMGWLTQLQGDTERAKATYEEMLKLSRELDDKGNVATALNSLGMLGVAEGNNERARALLEENLAVLEELEEEEKAATVLKRYHALNLLGILAINEEGDYTRGATLFEESLALAREAGDAYRVAANLVALQYAAVLQGNYERATALYEEALAVARELGNAGVEIIPEALVNLGLAALGQGDHQRAVVSFKEALVMSQTLERKPTVINTLEGMASLAGVLGEASRAAHLWGAAEASRQVTDIALPPGERALHEPYLASVRSQLGEEAWEAALAEGQAMSLQEAAQYALSEEESATPEQPSSGAQPPNLTPREQEVAVLVARNLTNRQIASDLTLSEHTVATHVRNILKKLGLRSRSEIAAWFTQQR